jgi:Holliday junction resolvasome RuvABC endonuclease subunit
MIKISIKKIEDKLKKQVRRSCLSIGFDVAEKYTGICILKVDEKYITIDHTEVIQTNPKEDTFHRVDKFEDSLGKFKQLLNGYNGFKILIIEKCFYGRNIQTLINLAQFGILVYTTLKNDFNTFHYIGATSARSVIGFNQKRQSREGTLKAKAYTRDTKDRKGKIKHRKGELKKIDCKSLVHDYLKTDFNLEFDTKDEADAFVLSLAGTLL